MTAVPLSTLDLVLGLIALLVAAGVGFWMSYRSEGTGSGDSK